MHPKRMNSSLAFFILLVVFLSLVLGQPAQLQADTITFTAEELLGKPTDTSVTVNIVPAATIEYYYEYGTSQGGPYTDETAPVTATGGQPHEVVITDELANASTESLPIGLESSSPASSPQADYFDPNPNPA